MSDDKQTPEHSSPLQAQDAYARLSVRFDAVLRQENDRARAAAPRNLDELTHAIAGAVLYSPPAAAAQEPGVPKPVDV